MICRANLMTLNDWLQLPNPTPAPVIDLHFSIALRTRYKRTHSISIHSQSISRPKTPSARLHLAPISHRLPPSLPTPPGRSAPGCLEMFSCAPSKHSYCCQQPNHSHPYKPASLRFGLPSILPLNDGTYSVRILYRGGKLPF